MLLIANLKYLTEKIELVPLAADTKRTLMCLERMLRSPFLFRQYSGTVRHDQVTGPPAQGDYAGFLSN